MQEQKNDITGNEEGLKGEVKTLSTEMSEKDKKIAEELQRHIKAKEKEAEDKRFKTIMEDVRKSVSIIFKQSYKKITKKMEIDVKKNVKYSLQMQVYGLTLWVDMAIDMTFGVVKKYLEPRAFDIMLSHINHSLKKHGYIMTPRHDNRPPVATVKREEKQNGEKRETPSGENKKDAPVNDSGTGEASPNNEEPNKG